MLRRLNRSDEAFGDHEENAIASLCEHYLRYYILSIDEMLYGHAITISPQPSGLITHGHAGARVDLSFRRWRYSTH